MKISDLVDRDAATCRAQDDLCVAAWKMQRAACRSLPVIDRLCRVVGILTERDVRLAVTILDRAPGAITAAEACGERPDHRFRVDLEGSTVLAAMRKRSLHDAVIVDRDGRFVGVVTLDDLTAALRVDIDDRERALDAQLAGKRVPAAAFIEAATW